MQNGNLLWKPDTPSARKEVNSLPSPFGEGQTDMPINHVHLGEVHQTPLPSPPRGRSRTLLNRNSILANRHNHQPTSPFPFILSGATAFWERRRRREERGERSYPTQASASCPKIFVALLIWLYLISPNIYPQIRVVSRLQSPHNLKLSTNVCRR